jgi:hypothetical protein
MGVPARHASKATRAGHWVTAGDWFPYLNGTSQDELVLSVAEGTPEDAQKDDHIRGPP